MKIDFFLAILVFYSIFDITAIIIIIDFCLGLSGATNGNPATERYRCTPQWHTAHTEGGGGDAVPAGLSQGTATYTVHVSILNVTVLITS